MLNPNYKRIFPGLKRARPTSALLISLEELNAYAHHLRGVIAVVGIYERETPKLWSGRAIVRFFSPGESPSLSEGDEGGYSTHDGFEASTGDVGEMVGEWIDRFLDCQFVSIGSFSVPVGQRAHAMVSCLLDGFDGLLGGRCCGC